MTFKEIREECIALLGDEYSASQEEITVLHTRLGKCVNYAYERIARSSYHPVKTETVTTDSRCRVSKSTLTESFWYLRGARCNDRCVTASVENNTIFIGHAPNSNVEITYSYVPRFMIQDSDEPCIPQGEITPMAYIFTALSIFMASEGRSDDAVLWNAQADAALAGSAYRPAHAMPQGRWR